MKIIAMNLNPCIDWQCSVKEYVHGGLNRVKRTRQDVAGKGINVGIVLKNLGLDPEFMGFNFVENGFLLTDKLNEMGIRHNFTEVGGAIRTNIKLYEEITGKMTELNQPGDFVCEKRQSDVLDKTALASENTGAEGILVLSGSRPQGVSADFYARLMNKWSGMVFLDTEGEALRLALEEKPPFALKPNLFELESTFGMKFETKESIAGFCKEKFIARGVKIVCVSMGAEGALLVTQKNAFFSHALNVEAKGVAGAGDAMVAGLVYATVKSLPDEELLPTAMAAASASVILDGTQMCTRESFEEFLTIAKSTHILLT
ncbi:MAG: 1-phosphofructokinase family hexose kinase [Defluviitaleaceae bacterium]|nr:1-phosphofructokinase family hexose kinase [Defluviitaleaceae bacterium]